MKRAAPFGLLENLGHIHAAINLASSARQPSILFKGTKLIKASALRLPGDDRPHKVFSHILRMTASIQALYASLDISLQVEGNFERLIQYSLD